MRAGTGTQTTKYLLRSGALAPADQCVALSGGPERSRQARSANLGKKPTQVVTAGKRRFQLFRDHPKYGLDIFNDLPQQNHRHLISRLWI